MIRFIVLLVAMTAVPGLAAAQQLPTDLLNVPVDGSVAAWIIRTFGLLTVLAGTIVDLTVTLAAASARGVLVRRPAAMVRVRQAGGAIVCGLAALLPFA